MYIKCLDNYSANLYYRRVKTASSLSKCIWSVFNCLLQSGCEEDNNSELIDDKNCPQSDVNRKGSRTSLVPDRF